MQNPRLYKRGWLANHGLHPTALSRAQIDGSTCFVVGFVAEAHCRSRAAGDARAVKRLVAKVRQPQPKSLPNQALPFDWLCDIIASRINRYFIIVACLWRNSAESQPIVKVGGENVRH